MENVFKPIYCRILYSIAPKPDKPCFPSIRDATLYTYHIEMMDNKHENVLKGQHNLA